MYGMDGRVIESNIEELKKHGGNIRILAERLGIDADGLVDFSSNINPYGPPKSVVDAVKRAVDNINEYPEQNAETLISAIARRTGISDENIVVGNGSIELIHLLPQVLKTKTALLLIPSFTEYEVALHRAGAQILYTRTFVKEEALRAVQGPIRDIDLVILGNPNNPCGYKIEKQELLDAIDKNPGCLWVVDEAFIDFTEGGDKNSLAGEAAARDNLLVLRSLTKIYSIAGLRLGYLVAHKDNAAAIREAKYPWSINSIAIEAGVAAINDARFAEDSVKALSFEAKRLYAGLKRINGLSPYMPEANYILVRIKRGVDSKELQNLLLYKGIAIRDCSTFTGMNESFFRVAVKRPEDNDRLLRALKGMLG